MPESFTRPRRAAAAFVTTLLLSLSAGPALALDPTLPPSGNFNLRNWKLTLPTGSEVQTSELSHGYTRSGVFFTDARTGGMVFRCPNIAGTTANSKYSRTELREMLSPTSSASSDANNWTNRVGGTMKARLRVDRVSKTGDSDKVGRVIIGQIHGPETEVVRLYFHKKPGEAKGRIYAAMETVYGSTSWSPDIVSNKDGGGIALGELFTYVIQYKGNKLTLTILRNQGSIVNSYIKYVDSRYDGLNLYFKAGVYNQNNTGESSDYAQATFNSLTHTH